jgi:PTS system nitrogen regulatory IIA component
MDPVLQWSSPQEIALDLDVSSRWEALRAVSAEIERSRGLSAPPIFRALWRREQAASTALGKSFALPHARIAGIAEPVTVYARTRTPIDFAAPDHRSVSELFVLLVPSDADNAKHLQLLALVAEMFSDDAFRTRLLQASDAASIRSIFKRWIDRDSRVGVTIAA